MLIERMNGVGDLVGHSIQGSLSSPQWPHSVATSCRELHDDSQCGPADRSRKVFRWVPCGPYKLFTRPSKVMGRPHHAGTIIRRAKGPFCKRLPMILA